MKRLFHILSYVLVAALGYVVVTVLHRKADPGCTQVIVSEFGEPRLYRDQVCSEGDLARVYGEQKLREEKWIDAHDCDLDTNEPDVKDIGRRLGKE